ncbi:hypothetical protein Ga0074812_11540 [Parafrankia irregularis]|uniref:Uncharacterized protein n=1 Tax=Parafrankia irregularis TaxID=795642 RepID=A0A0S4QRY9_9ACTN|nr:MULTISPECIES: hypothetical protein [Parafrankia]MBE3202654.1 hypothetical protein [Parafrankia sp. CH37]CUU57838.1 hypothetical protein Ga0074812_11540 [Parafrankia irregularis]
MARDWLTGKEETDAARRTRELRESGYTGWIDQDGNAKTEEQVIAENPWAEKFVRHVSSNSKRNRR